MTTNLWTRFTSWYWVHCVPIPGVG